MVNADGFTLGEPLGLKPEAGKPFTPFPFTEGPDLSEVDEAKLQPNDQGLLLAKAEIPHSDLSGAYIDNGRRRYINHVVATFNGTEIFLKRTSEDDIDHGKIQQEGVGILFFEEDDSIFSMISQAIDRRKHPWNPPTMPALPESTSRFGKAGNFATKVFSTLNRPYYEVIDDAPEEDLVILHGRIISPRVMLTKPRLLPHNASPDAS